MFIYYLYLYTDRHIYIYIYTYKIKSLEQPVVLEVTLNNDCHSLKSCTCTEDFVIRFSLTNLLKNL